MRAIYGPRQLQEVMTAFWFNHFNVFAGKGLCHLWIGAYEQEAIRPHTMGRFRTLLGATAKHPAMLFYLDNWQNSAPNSFARRGKFEGINENYAREVMELHTLGVNGGYTQADVTALAHILTGWGLQRRGQAGMRMGAAGMGAPGRALWDTRHGWMEAVAAGPSSAVARRTEAISTAFTSTRAATTSATRSFSATPMAAARESPRASRRWTCWRAPPPPRAI